MSDNKVKLNLDHLIMLEKPSMKIKTYPRLTKLIVDSNYKHSPNAMRNFTTLLAHPRMREQIKEVIAFHYHNRHVLKTTSIGELLKMDPMSAFGTAAVSGIKSLQPDGKYRNPLDKEFMWPYTRLPNGPTIEMRIPKARLQRSEGPHHFTYNPDLKILE